MGYELDGVLARRVDISTWNLKSALVYPLTPELGLIPLTWDFATEVKPLEDWLKNVSRSTKVAHLSAEYFGGAGGQDCTLWVDGTSKAHLKINAVLAEFGVTAKDGADEFDTVGLGQFRKTHKWAAAAIVEPINESVDKLIDALSYKCDDRYVEETVRSIAAEQLGALKAVEAVEHIKRLLDDKEYGTRLSAAVGLGKLGAPAIATMIEALPEQEDPWGLIFSMGKMGTDAKPAAPHLVALLRHNDWKIRLECIKTLELIGCLNNQTSDNKDFRKAVEKLLKDKERLVADAAKRALT